MTLIKRVKKLSNFMIRIGSDKVLYPELDQNGQIQFKEVNNGAIYSDEERPHYMDQVKRSMT